MLEKGNLKTKTMLKLTRRPQKVKHEALFSRWPKGRRLASTSSGMCFIPNGTMTRKEAQDDKEFNEPAFMHTDSFREERCEHDHHEAQSAWNNMTGGW